jgi:hypothetical protein
VFFAARWEDFCDAGRHVGRKRSTNERGISVSDETLDRGDEPRDDDNTVEAHSLDSLDSLDQLDAVDAKDDDGDDVQAHSFDAPAAAAAMDQMDQMD